MYAPLSSAASAAAVALRMKAQGCCGSRVNSRLPSFSLTLSHQSGSSRRGRFHGCHGAAGQVRGRRGQRKGLRRVRLGCCGPVHSRLSNEEAARGLASGIHQPSANAGAVCCMLHRAGNAPRRGPSAPPCLPAAAAARSQRVCVLEAPCPRQSNCSRWQGAGQVRHGRESTRQAAKHRASRWGRAPQG